MAATRVVNSPTANPGRRAPKFPRKDGKRYVFVEKDNPKYDFESPYEDMMEKASLVDPSKDLYEKVAETKRGYTLEYAEADAKAMERQSVQVAKQFALDPNARGLATDENGNLGNAASQYTRFDDQDDGGVFTSE